MSLEKAVRIILDHDAEEGKDTIYDENGKVKALAIAKRVIDELPSIPLTSSDESYERKSENEGLSKEELENEGLRDDKMEFIRGEVFVPEITSQGKQKLDEVSQGQSIGIYVDRVGRKKFEEKYLGSKKFAFPVNYVLKVTTTGIFPDYSGLNVPEVVDEALGTKRENRNK